MSILASISLSLLIAVAGEADGPRRMLIGRDLSRTEYVVESLDAAGVHVRDSRGSKRVIPHAEVLGLYQPGRSPAAPTSSVLTLTDGQRLIGAAGAAEPGTEHVTITHPLLGAIAVPLDEVVALTMPGMPAVGESAGGDTVLLVNGDVVRGFVTELGAVVRIEDGAGAERAIGLDSVALVTVENEPRRPSGAMMWLADGSVISVSMPGAPEPGLVTIEPVLRSGDAGGASEAEQRSTPTATILENVIGWMPDASRLAPLSGLELVSAEPLSPRPWTDPPRVDDRVAGGVGTLGALDVLMPGPCVAVWTLPQGADGFTCEFVLPEAFRDWGDCVVIVGASGGADGGAAKELWRGRLNAESPAATVALDLVAGSRTLVVTVEPGELGPVQDRPTIAAAFVRVGAR
jgi:hypothetical protein